MTLLSPERRDLDPLAPQDGRDGPEVVAAGSGGRVVRRTGMRSWLWFLRVRAGGIRRRRTRRTRLVMSRRLSSSDRAVSVSSSRRMPWSNAICDTTALVVPRTTRRSPSASTARCAGGEQGDQLVGLRGLHDHRGLAAGGDRRRRLGGEQPAAADHDEVVGEHAQLADEVARHEDRAAAGRRSRSGSSAASGCRRGRGRWTARRAAAPAGRPAGRRPAPAAGACRARTRPPAGRRPSRARRRPARPRPGSAGMPLTAAMARRWLRAVRPGCMQRASSTAADDPGRVLEVGVARRRRSGPRRGRAG